MKQNLNIEAEGQELILRNTNSDYVIIPKKYRTEVQGMIKDGCHGCIDALVETLPTMADYAQDGSLYPEEPSINPNKPILLSEVVITAKAPTYIKYRQNWEKEHPFDINKYVEDRFNNPIGREAISRINEKKWRAHLRQEGLKKRQSELDNATKMGLLYQRFNPQDKDDIPIADEQFEKRYGTSPHRYRYDNDPEYRKYCENAGRNAAFTIDYPSTDLRRKGVVNPNNMWMYPNLTGESQKTMTDFSNEVIGMALPIPGLEAMGKIPSVFKVGKNIVKTGSKVLNKTDDIVRPIASSVDDVNKSVKPAWQMQEMPGLHLKSTMEGEAISKIVEPKTGLINTEQALAIIGKESGGKEKVELIRKGFGDNIPPKMDYNEFRKTVQDQLIPLERQFSGHASDYGIDRLGYSWVDRNTILQDIANDKIKLQKYLSGELKPSTEWDINILKHNIEYKEQAATELLENQTLILGNKGKFGRGSSAHGNPEETLGHIHFLRDAETPDVLTVTQIQSDAFQGTHRRMPKGKLDKVPNTLNYIDERGTLFDEATVKNISQKQLLDKNHQERFLQELVDYAGKRGDVNKVRLPTSETAAKVQGYSKLEPEVDPERIAKIKRQIEQGKKRALEASPEDKVKWERGVKSLELELQGGYEFQHQTILKKYAEQPKTIKKLFGIEPKIVTDSKGNTWYEFDIPKKFKEGKGEIKAFGLIPPAIGIGAVIQSQEQNKKEQ